MKNNETDTILDSNCRRNLLIGATAITASLASSISLATTDHSHQHMKKPDGDLIDAALSCIKKGESCSAHCLHLVKWAIIPLPNA